MFWWTLSQFDSHTITGPSPVMSLKDFPPSRKKKAKEKWLADECKEIELLDARHDSFNMHKRVKQAAGIFRGGGVCTLLNRTGRLLNLEEKLTEWKTYVEALFSDSKGSNPTARMVGDGLDITKSEVQRVMR